MTDVFLSYASADRAKAEKVERALSAAGYAVFWDQETPPGKDWDSWIREQLAAAPASIVLWSKASIASPNVRHEAMLARDAGKLIPAFLEPLKPSDFPMGLYLVQGADLSRWSGEDSDEELQSLIAQIAARVGSRKAAAPSVEASRSREIWLIGGLGAAAALVALALIVMARVDSHAPSDASASSASAVQAVAVNSVADEPAVRAMIGSWRWSDDMPCAEGSQASLVGNQLVFVSPGARHVHDVVSVSGSRVSTIVREPEEASGESYELEIRSDGTLRVHRMNVRASSDFWTRCDLKQ